MTRCKYSVSVILAVVLVLLPVAGFAEDSFWSESYRQEAMGKYDAAMDSINTWMKKHPKHEFGIMRRGWLNYLQGKYSDSIKDYQHAISINDKSLEARLGMMLPLMAQNKWREAAVYGHQILDVAPWNYYAHVRLLRCEEALEQWSALAEHGNKVFLRYPSDATIIVYLARAHDKLGNVKAAVKAYEDVLERVPGHVEALQYIATKQKK